MSGIVGIFERRGSPVDRSLLEALVDLLAYRGPNGRGIWTGGPVGLAHALLRTVRESAGERQPLSLDGRLWITADARLDRRSELIAEIETHGLPTASDVPDADLILRSYALWAEDCLDHLRGDFAFAIWDVPRSTLFCARDHFGIKPFYYADLGHVFLFGNTLDCLRAHPEVSDELNDAAIADFLLRGFNSDLETTSFRDIRRLPPAHFLIASEDGIRAQRYWSPPVDGRIRYRRAAEYVEHFQALLSEAVADRLRCDRAGVWMSGGMDSSTLAATACGLSRAPTEIRGYTMVYDSLIPDIERTHAQQVADFLGVSIRYLEMDELPLFGGLDRPALDTPEPVEDPFFAGIRDQYQLVSNDCRVMLSGEGADSLMHFRMWPYMRDLFRRREWRHLFSEVPAYLWIRPFPWKGIRQRCQRLFGAKSGTEEALSWLSPELVAHCELKTQAKSVGPPLFPSHPFAPVAHAFLSAPQWSAIFELADPGVTRAPVETRYPFLDLRVVEFFLAIPPFPWAYRKLLLRESMSGRLPPATLRRPKTPLAGDPIQAALMGLNAPYLEKLPWDGEISRYIGRSALQRHLKTGNLADPELLIKPLCLNFWLQSGRRIRYKIGAEVRNG
jgi:asparagine synthase (glutamine-hydrolysing)